MLWSITTTSDSPPECMRELKTLEMMLRLDASDVLRVLDADVVHYLDIVRDWTFEAPPDELNLVRASPTLYQVSHFLKKHGFPNANGLVGPYALPLADMERKVCVLVEGDHSDDGGGPANCQIGAEVGDWSSSTKMVTSIARRTESRTTSGGRKSGLVLARFASGEGGNGSLAAASFPNTGRSSEDATHHLLAPCMVGNAAIWRRGMRRHLEQLGWEVLSVNEKVWLSLEKYEEKASYVRSLLMSRKLLQL